MKYSILGDFKRASYQQNLWKKQAENTGESREIFRAGNSALNTDYSR